MEFEDARVGAEKEKYGILGKTVKIIKTPLARHTENFYVIFVDPFGQFTLSLAMACCLLCFSGDDLPGDVRASRSDKFQVRKRNNMRVAVPFYQPDE